jgi:hypothetical protein
MRMIPDVPHGTHSQSEKRVFDLLRSSFSDEKDGVFTAYHSLNLTRHAYKRFGEIDFLICCPQGLFALEVKGGRVGCKDGIWRYTNRYGDVTESAEGPFKQVESALHGLMSNLRSNLPNRALDQFSIGFGVIFPDCDCPTAGAEWDPHTLADAQSYKGMEKWLRQLFRYWRSKDGGERSPDAEALKALRRYLRPEFDTVIPLHVQVSASEERIASMTEDQMGLVDFVAANQRVLCSGGAGTGKTFLAMELARRWTAQGLRVVLVCKSPWLKSYLSARFNIQNLTVSLVDGLPLALRRQGVQSFDALIVDEGQDLFDMESLDHLDAALHGGLGEGRWCIFHDSNNQAGLFGCPDKEAMQYLSSLLPALAPLRTNCRNTRVILEKVQAQLKADMGVRGAGEGPKIREQAAVSKEEAARRLTNELVELVEQGGLSPGEVTILSPYGFDDSCASQLPDRWLRQVTVLDEYSLRAFPLPSISFASIANFKGLENEAIIVVDLASPIDGGSNIVEHYVGMSRARSLLSLIWQAE